MAEQINHPDWYGGEDNPFEVIKVLRAWDLELAKGFCWGNLIKYTARAGKKGVAAVADRQKAEWYAAELISIEAVLATRAKKAETKKGPSDIPIVINGNGRYHVEIDWEKRTTRVIDNTVREDPQFVGGGPVGGAGGFGVNTSGNNSIGGTVYNTGGPVGPAFGSPIGGSNFTSRDTRCPSYLNCKAGYHDNRCPLWAGRWNVP